ncbi:MAG: EamA family transporter RarD [Herpetosiphon sp.]
MNKGAVYAAWAYILWGLLPIFWKALHVVPALEIVAHRIVWSMLVVLVLVVLRGEARTVRDALRNRRIVLAYLVSALLLTMNWFVYIWAVNAGFVVEASLGYFMTPLVNVLLGMLFLHERLRHWQRVAVGVSVSGVLFLTAIHGTLPWIALALAGSFGLYGLVRKTAALDSLVGLTMETLLLLPAAFVYLLYLQSSGHGTFGHVSTTVNVLLAMAGVASALPLLLFAAGVRLITLTLLGLLQFIAPTIQFILGVWLYHEPFSLGQFAGFVLIWSALVIYSVEGFVRFRSRAPVIQATVPIRE